MKHGKQDEKADSNACSGCNGAYIVPGKCICSR